MPADPVVDAGTGNRGSLQGTVKSHQDHADHRGENLNTKRMRQLNSARVRTGKKDVRPRDSAMYVLIAADSLRTRSPSTSVGTWPSGFNCNIKRHSRLNLSNKNTCEGEVTGFGFAVVLCALPVGVPVQNHTTYRSIFGSVLATSCDVDYDELIRDRVRYEQRKDCTRWRAGREAINLHS